MMRAKEQDAAATMKLHGKSFWFASLFLPGQVASDAARLYAFCRRMDDLADIAVTQEKRELLAKVRHDLQQGISDDPSLADFLELAQQYDLPMDAADSLIGTFLEDAETPMLIDKERQLVRYCYGVAGTVGLMMSPILGADGPRAVAAAICLGIAMQMTNIARDVLEDALEGRRYLPGDWVLDVCPQAMTASPESRRDIASAVARLLDLADQYYAMAAAGFPLIPSQSRKGIAIAASVYREIGMVLRKRNCAWWEGRVTVSSGRKLWVAVRVLFGQAELNQMKTSTPVVDLWSPLEGLPGVR
jgi:phytoene synthase